MKQFMKRLDREGVCQKLCYIRLDLEDARAGNGSIIFVNGRYTGARFRTPMPNKYGRISRMFVK